jgi:hypothetical protein
VTDLIICLIVFLTASGTVTVSEVRLYLARILNYDPRSGRTYP